MSLEARFWAKVDKNGPVPEHVPELGKCWVWTGGRSRNGYGLFSRVGNRSRQATHIAWELATGLPPPRGLYVCHKCDEPTCVRPAHLFLGTARENMADMVAKGRQRKATVNAGGCSIADCGGNAFSHGLCSSHAYRLKRYGSPAALGPRHKAALGCEVEECGRKVKGVGMCRMHRERVLRHGSTAPPKKGPAPGNARNQWTKEKAA